MLPRRTAEFYRQKKVRKISVVTLKSVNCGTLFYIVLLKFSYDGLNSFDSNGGGRHVL